MRKVISSISIAICLLFISCGEDEESCSSNGQVNGECFNAVLSNYNVQSINRSNTSFTRENIFISYQFEGTRSDRYQITARANQYDDQDFSEDGVAYLFEEGRIYNESMMIFNGNINAPSSGMLTVVFSKVDRENGLISGSFDWSGSSDNLSGSFTDVIVEFEVD